MTDILSHNGSSDLNRKPHSNGIALSEPKRTELSRLIAPQGHPFDLALRLPLRLPLRLSVLRHLEGDES